MVGIWCVCTWQQLGCPRSLRLVELGPGRGTLMADLLRGTAPFAAFASALQVRPGALRALHPTPCPCSLHSSLLWSLKEFNISLEGQCYRHVDHPVEQACHNGRCLRCQCKFEGTTTCAGCDMNQVSELPTVRNPKQCHIQSECPKQLTSIGAWISSASLWVFGASLLDVALGLWAGRHGGGEPNTAAEAVGDPGLSSASRRQ